MSSIFLSTVRGVADALSERFDPTVSRGSRSSATSMVKKSIPRSVVLHSGDNKNFKTLSEKVNELSSSSHSLSSRSKDRDYESAFALVSKRLISTRTDSMLDIVSGFGITIFTLAIYAAPGVLEHLTQDTRQWLVSDDVFNWSINRKRDKDLITMTTDWTEQEKEKFRRRCDYAFKVKKTRTSSRESRVQAAHGILGGPRPAPPATPPAPQGRSPRRRPVPASRPRPGPPATPPVPQGGSPRRRPALASARRRPDPAPAPVPTPGLGSRGLPNLDVWYDIVCPEYLSLLGAAAIGVGFIWPDVESVALGEGRGMGERRSLDATADVRRAFAGMDLLRKHGVTEVRAGLFASMGSQHRAKFLFPLDKKKSPLSDVLWQGTTVERTEGMKVGAMVVDEEAQNSRYKKWAQSLLEHQLCWARNAPSTYWGALNPKHIRLPMKDATWVTYARYLGWLIAWGVHVQKVRLILDLGSWVGSGGAKWKFLSQD